MHDLTDSSPWISLLEVFRSGSLDEQREALTEAEKYRNELTPTLLGILRDAVGPPEDPVEIDVELLSFAAILLSHWEEHQALPHFIAFASLDEGELDDLWGDMITEDFATFFFKTGESQEQLLMELIEDPSAYVYLRSAAATALTYSVAAGRLPRERLLEFYRTLFSSEGRLKADSEDELQQVVELLFREWWALHPQSDLSLIEEVYVKYEMSPLMTGRLAQIRRQLTRQSADWAMDRLRSEMRERIPESAVLYTSWWSGEGESGGSQLPRGSRNFEALVPYRGTLSEDETAKLFEEAGSAFPFEEVRAYLLGAVIGLQNRSPSAWMGEVFFRGLLAEDSEPAPLTHEHVNAFMRVWNELVQWPSSEQPPVIGCLSNPEIMDEDHLLKTFLRTRGETDGLLRGLAKAGTYSPDIDAPGARAALVWLEEYENDLDCLYSEIFDSAEGGELKLSAELISRIRKSLLSGTQTWSEMYPVLREGLMLQRRLEMHGGFSGMQSFFSDEPYVRAGPKLGRNDPCSCGSGRKYKKCCIGSDAGLLS